MSGSLESLSINQILDVAKIALCSGFRDLKEYNVKDISLGDNSVLIHYIPKVENRVAIYSDICQIMAFITSFAGEELKKMGVYSIGVEAMTGGKTSSDNIHIASTINVAEEIGKGNVVYWLKNSIVNEPITAQKEVLLLVEGSTEINAYPILFKSTGYPLTAHRIKMFPYSEHNLKLSCLFLNSRKATITLYVTKINPMK